MLVGATVAAERAQEVIDHRRLQAALDGRITATNRAEDAMTTLHRVAAVAMDAPTPPSEDEVLATSNLAALIDWQGVLAPVDIELGVAIALNQEANG